MCHPSSWSYKPFVIIFEMLILNYTKTFQASTFFPWGKEFVSRQEQMDAPRFSQGSHREWNLELLFFVCGFLLLGSPFSSFIKQSSSWVMYGLLELGFSFDVWNVHYNFLNTNVWKWQPLGTPTERADDRHGWKEAQGRLDGSKTDFTGDCGYLER